MSKFYGVDYYDIDGLLTSNERMVRDTARDFVDNEILPIIRDHHRNATFPKDLIPKMGSLGFFGPTLPTEYGCAGINNVAYGLVMQELERGDSAIRSCASVQGSLVMYPIHRFGSEAQKERWLPMLAEGKAVGCFGLTEPDHGSDPGGMTTTAKKVDGGFILNGEKMWITNGTIADVAIVWTKLDGVVRGFLVEKGTPGFSTKEIEGKFSLRASITASLSFTDCRISEENLLPKTEGLQSALSCLTQARYGIAWGAVGAAQSCYHAALKYAKGRRQFGKPIASFQLVQEKLVNMVSEITKAQLLCWRLGHIKDAGTMRHEQVSLAKRDNVAMALDCARTARDILGAAGIVDEHPVIRHMLNLESVKTYEGTHDIHTLIIGKDITDISALE